MKERHVCEQGCRALAHGTAMVSPALGQGLGLGSGLRPLVLWQQPRACAAPGLHVGLGWAANPPGERLQWQPLACVQLFGCWERG